MSYIEVRELGGNNATIQFGEYNTDSFQSYKTAHQKVLVDNENQHREIVKWGKRNDLPEQREQLIIDNSIVPTLMRTARNALVGQGLLAYTDRIESGKRIREEVEMDPRVQAFLDTCEIEDYLDAAASELVKHSSMPVEFIPNKGKTGIASLKPMRNIYARKVARENGKSQGTVWHHWNTGTRDEQRLENAIHFPRFEGTDANKKANSVRWYEDFLFNDGYYAIPAWWGDWDWIDLANRIPRFHKAGLDNGWNIRYHVEVPKNYFDGDATAQQVSRAQLRKQAAAGTSLSAKEEQEKKSRKQQFLQKLDDCFKGVTNNGRILLTTYEINVAVGKEFPGVKIHVIDNKLQGDALQKLYDSSNQANISALGVPAALAAIQTAGKMSAGSEVRNTFLMYILLQTPRMRRLMIQPIIDALKFNAVDYGHKIGFRDLDITKLDESKTAQAEAVNGERV